MSERIHIVIAEPSFIIRSGVSSVLKRMSSMDIDVAEVTDIMTLTEHIKNLNPDALIVNPLNLGAMYINKLKSETKNEGMKIIALQTNLADKSTLASYDATISIYDSVDKIKETISHLLSDETKTEASKELSQREKEIIVCIVKGMTNKAIAEKLFISTHTVIAHRRNITAKLQIGSPAGLTIYAIVNNLVDISDVNS